jgi:hypothetical protein
LAEGAALYGPLFGRDRSFALAHTIPRAPLLRAGEVIE